MKLRRDLYEPCSGIQLSDASETTQGLLHLVSNLRAECLVSRTTKWIRVRTKGGKPAMQIRSYTRETPEVRMHFRTGNNKRKESELFTTMGLRTEDWSKKTDEGSHRYVGGRDNLLVNTERAL